MKVILLNNIKKMGSRFDVIDVADGFAQNFLIPQKKAIPATPENMSNLDLIKSEQASVIAKERQEVEVLIKKLRDVEIHYKALANEQGGLYESISSSVLAEILSSEAEIDLDEVYILLEAPIKKVGEYEVPCAYENITGSFKVVVIAEEVAK